ncbi:MULTISPECIES: tail fiber domain-containing protein [unclassified Moorena]|uniref:tail fiber domain-containing protein n=1 Tax=unclassified Moorena TaxID=2683338 RepID=UPI0013BE2493|nr:MULTISPECIES: tail fiber domain-containing protein [unclassified Moorena]NEP68638.1 hypothetical protein [Moorena sp. SIO3A5]NER90412.1 hypothetical protein [Moorena sp. SIO3A2]
MKYIQRPNYFTSQFLVEKDFNDEQAYHRDMRLRHNSLLHDWGVVEGLEVTRAGQKKIAVSEGMAIDKYGREIIVLPDCTVPDTINTINLDGLELEPNTTTTIEITVIYDEIKDDGDEVAVGNDKKYTRTTERPKFVIYGSKTSKDNLQDGNVDVKTGFAPTDDNVILLARVTLDNNGEVSENAVDNSVRKLAGPKLSNLDKLELDGTISAENLNLTGNSTIDGSLTVNGNLEVKGDVIARDTEHIAGDVSLGDADNHEVKVTGVIRSGHSSGALRVDDGLHTTGALTVDGNVGIGTNNPRQKLEVAGTVKATRFEGDGSGLTGIGAGKWSDGGSNGIYYNHGNVGIGTNSTYAELTVNGSIGFANGTAPMMYIHQSGTNNAPRPIIAHSPRYRNWGVEYRDHEDLMVFQGSGQPVLSVGLRSKKVGIGITNPTEKLEVDGTVKATRFEGDGSGLTGISAGGTKWSDGSNNSIYYNHGNVGICTNRTYAELTVNGSIGFANGTAPMMYIHQRGTNNAPRPIIAHSPSHPNWGVEYRDHGDLMVFQGSGEPVLSVGLRSKKVGIGTNNPRQKLEVAGTVKATRFEGDGSGLTGISAGGETKWYDGSNNSIYYNNGNVGIGTNSTYAELTVNGSIGFANGTAPMMYIHQSGTNNAPRPIIAHSRSHPNWGVEYRDQEDLMVFQGSGEPVLSVALRSKKVGIGITNPTEKLEVAGTVKATRFEGDGSGLTGIRAGSETKWYDGSNNSIYYNHGNVGIGTNSTYAELTVNGSIGFANGTAPMMYIHQSGTNNAPRPIIAHSPRYRNWGVEYREHGDLMVFQGSGEPVLSVGLGSKKVGIGITNPTEKLEVVGTVKATRFEGDGSGLTGISAGGTKWSDGGSNRIYYNAGNVGIGTNNPTQKLEVAGTVKAIATHTGRDSAYGVYSQAHGSDSGSKFGLYAQATGGSSGTRFGVYGGASGGSAQYGGYFTATHTGNRTAYGVQSVVSGNGNGTKYGLHAQATGGSSGTRFGVYGNASGGQTQYGGYFIATNRGNTNAFGVWSQVAGNGNGTKFGLHAQATGGSSGARFGVRGIASGGQTQYGGHFTATNTGNTTAFGVHSTVTGNENGTKYGLYARATGGPSGTRFGVYGRADAQNNSSAIVYGVYGVASGGKTSYAGYFEGNVHVNGHLTYRTIGQVSSRELKENINTLAIEDAIETLEGLNPVQFSYKKDHQKETHIGFIAEDVPDLVASHDRKTLSPMDIVAVLTKVVKEQNNTISLLMEKVQTLEQKSQSSAF